MAGEAQRCGLWEADVRERFIPALASRKLPPHARAADALTWSVEAPPPSVRVGARIAKYGHEFVWTERHLSAAQLQPLRQRGDAMMDAALPECPGRDVLATLRRVASSSPQGDAARLLRLAEQPPAWVDWEMVALGQATYRRYLPLAGVVLFHMSLVGGFSAPLIAKVLSSTGYLTGAPNQVVRRLLETGRLLTDSCEADGALRPNGAGWCSALRVRALHAHVRRRLQRSDRWDSTAWGVGINQEDMAVTLLAFSYNVMIGCEVILGAEWSKEEQQAYLHMWRYIGWLLGVEDDCNPCHATTEEARVWLESIIMHILEPDELSTRLSAHLLRATADFRRGGGAMQHQVQRADPDRSHSTQEAEGAAEAPPSEEWVRKAQVTRLLLGDTLGDAMKLPFVPRQRFRARRILLCLRAYGWLCRTPIMGSVLSWVHRQLLRMMRKRGGDAMFVASECPLSL
ncbi:hypothetical protein AB1Y20_009413 [Prymnesium parvum]|uniref:ER-bound oxygenase mpaB/mpaB'/Rubber oxygenase catalytic domain-containing protein n=1 Tax=Prymnesium parvum TaxID=97485 RepID=A0AB34K501_PRYPA